MGLSINQHLEAKIVMTPQISQAIKIMEMSSNELERYLEEIQISNPLIEVSERNTYGERIFNKTNNVTEFSSLELKVESSPVEMLMQQIRLSVRNANDLSLLSRLIFNLNEFGFFPNALQLMSEDEYNHILKILESNDYIGVGAVDLKHSLSLQAKYYYPDDPLLLELINSLELIAERCWDKIIKRFQISDIQLKQAINKIKTLNPRPFSTSNLITEVIQPDIVIEIENKQISYSLSDWFTPTISFQEMKGLTLSNQDIKQITEWTTEAKWIIQALQQRKATMIKIMDFLLTHQYEAFLKGLNFVKPLTLKDVSIVIDRHESTVSRATMNKYIQTPWGVFSMKELFSSKILTQNGDNISKEKIKYLVKKLIEKEDKSHPLSDQKLSEIIHLQESLDISRRTITKYREELQIPSSTKRKEL